MKTDKTPIYYLCDRTACRPCNSDCKYTRNIAHAKNFRPEFNDETAKKQSAFGFFENEYRIEGGDMAADIPDKGGGR